MLPPERKLSIHDSDVERYRSLTVYLSMCELLSASSRLVDHRVLLGLLTFFRLEVEIMLIDYWVMISLSLSLKPALLVGIFSASLQSD